MIGTLNALIVLVEQGIGEEIDVAAFARRHGTTEYHLRRMFSALAQMPLSEYIRRRRMTLAAADLVAGESNQLTVAVRYGYGSIEAFGRAFRAVHGTGPVEVRRSGGPLNTQPILRFLLTVEGNFPMNVTITHLPACVLVGHSAKVPLIHEGVNPYVQEFISSFAPEEHMRLKSLGNAEPAGILAVTLDLEQDAPEGAMLTYLHGVAVTATTAETDELDAIRLDAGTWAVFSTSGSFPEALQRLWASTATDWIPSNPWRLRPGPSILRYLELTDSHATCELWLPIEQA